LLDTIPGIDCNAVCALIAEIGAHMAQFPSARHLARWTGLCPGNHESAGKRLPGRTRYGCPWLRGLIAQVEWIASRAQSAYLASVFRCVMLHRGKKRALIAIARSARVISRHILTDRRPYQDLGPDYFERYTPSRPSATTPGNLNTSATQLPFKPRMSQLRYRRRFSEKYPCWM
jgi:transposase